jgi:hypothetical protein
MICNLLDAVHLQTHDASNTKHVSMYQIDTIATPFETRMSAELGIRPRRVYMRSFIVFFGHLIFEQRRSAPRTATLWVP